MFDFFLIPGMTDSDTKNDDLEKKIKETFVGMDDSNVTIIAHYLNKYPKKWKSETFKDDVNKLLPEAFAYNMRPSNTLMGAVIAVVVILLIAVIWWLVTKFVKRNNNNVIQDPTIVNPIFI